MLDLTGCDSDDKPANAEQVTHWRDESVLVMIECLMNSGMNGGGDWLTLGGVFLLQRPCEGRVLIAIISLSIEA